MMRKIHKKGQMTAVILGFVIVVAIVASGFILKSFGDGGFSIGDTETETAETASCDGVASVKYLYDDKNFYKFATDPGTNVTFYEPIRKTVADDATSTTVPIRSTLKGLAANTNGAPDTTYFGEKIEVVTACKDIEDMQSQPELRLSGAPTLTVVGDDGITKITSAQNQTSLTTDTEFDAFVTVKAPTDKCAARHGALVAVEYDATYINKIDSDLASSSLGILEGHSSFGSTATFDQWAVFMYPGDLCDSDKDEVKISYTTTGTVTNDGANFKVRWLPMNLDLDGDSLTPLPAGVYDEDNNFISIGNSSIPVYTSDAAN